MCNGTVRGLRVVAVLSALAASNAWAADTGFYFGVPAGQSDFDVGSGLVSFPPVLVAFSSGGPPNRFAPRAGNVVTAVPAGSESRTRVDERDATFSAEVGYTF